MSAENIKEMVEAIKHNIATRYNVEYMQNEIQKKGTHATRETERICEKKNAF